MNLTGGEPMLRDDIEDMVESCFSKAKLVEISTNGYYTDRILSIAKRFRRVMFRVSLEGLPAQNDRLRGTKDGFDHALRTMLGLIESPARDVGFSIVICDENADDLIDVYRLCAALGVEFGNSVMHNSWYFHKRDNKVVGAPKAVLAEKAFIRALLQSPRRQLRLKAKDYLRAYFNLNILNHLEGRPNVMDGCVAGRDLFFVDPAGNVLPCNGSADPWVMGNLHDQTFDTIWNSPQGEAARKRVLECDLSCAFIGTARFDMMRRPLKPLRWVVGNKCRLALGGDVRYEA